MFQTVNSIMQCCQCPLWVDAVSPMLFQVIIVLQCQVLFQIPSCHSGLSVFYPWSSFCSSSFSILQLVIFTLQKWPSLIFPGCWCCLLSMWFQNIDLDVLDLPDCWWLRLSQHVDVKLVYIADIPSFQVFQKVLGCCKMSVKFCVLCCRSSSSLHVADVANCRSYRSRFVMLTFLQVLVFPQVFKVSSAGC